MKITRLVHGEEITGNRDVTDTRNSGGGIMTEPETATPPAKQPGRLPTWLRAHRLAAASLGVATLLVIAGAGVGGWAITQQVEHDTAASAAAEALGLVQSTEDLLDSSRTELEDAAADAIAYRDAAAAAGKDAGPYLGAPATAELTKAINALSTTLAKTVTADSTSEAVTLRAGYAAAPADDDQLSTVELEQLRADREAEAAKIATKATATSDLALELANAADDVDEALQAIATGAAKVAEQFGASYPSATQAAKDTLAAALKALSKQTEFTDADSLAVVTAYVAAAKGVEASHTAEEARKAQEAANAANGGPDGTGGTGGGDGGGYYGGPGTGGNGGDGGPGGDGGGTVDNNRYVQTNGYYVPMSSCTWATDDGTHDPGPGGTSVVSSTYPWSYVNMGTYIQFYRC